ncbi:MAG: hypothetical protein Q9213_005386 [Squamulea squamosa]
MEGLGYSLSTDWEHIVTGYSGLELTRLAKDRFIALSNIANEVACILEAPEDARSNSGILSDDDLGRRYVCGLWLMNIHRQLLWEQAAQGSRERLPGILTWSWASMASHNTNRNNERVLTGMGVRWPKMDFLEKRKRVCKVRKAITIPVDEQSWLPQFSQRPVPDIVPNDEFSNENRFIVLYMHSSLQPVQIGNLLSDEDADLANASTSENPDDDRRIYTGPNPKIIAPDPPRGMGLWRGICFPTNPHKLTGWASVEHPDLQSDEEIASCYGSIYALYLERCEEEGGLLHLSDRLVSRVVFTILLVRRVQIPGMKRCFERVGVGRLFGKEADGEYRAAGKTTISLV